MKRNFFTHQTAFIDKGAKVGTGTKIWHNSHITKEAVIGKNSTIGQNCYVAGEVGDNCKLQNNVNVYAGVILKDYVFCGPSMTFTNILIPRAKYPRRGQWVKTLVKEGASFGAASVVVCGVKVGKGALIGAGSVVTKDIPDYALVYGNPMEIKGWICECGKKMPFNFTVYRCPKCYRHYLLKNGKVKKA